MFSFGRRIARASHLLSNPFNKNDQDALNIAVMTAPEPVSIMGSEGMDFRQGDDVARARQNRGEKNLSAPPSEGGRSRSRTANSGNTPTAPYRSTRRAPCAGAGSRWQSAMPSDVSIAGPEDFWTIS